MHALAVYIELTGKPEDTTDLREWMRTFCSVSANMRSRAELSGPRVVSSSLQIGNKDQLPVPVSYPE
jgi:hypothetical protein